MATAAALAAAAAGAVEPGAYLAARQADRSGDVAAAARAYAEALRQDPRNLGMLEAGAIAALAAGEMRSGLSLSRRLIAEASDHRIANLALIADEIERGELDAAASRLTERAGGFNDLTRVLLQGWVAFGQGDRAAAEAAFSGLDQGTLQQVFGLYHLGLMRAALADHAGALAAFEEASGLVTAPTSRLSAAHGAALEALGRTDEAAAIYERMAAASPLGDPTMDAALARLDAGGEPSGPLVATAADGAAEALFSLAAALANEEGRRFALVHAQLAAHLRPGLAAAHLLIGELLESDGQFDGAIAAYEKAPPEDPLRVRAQIGRASALEQLDRTDAAAEALRALVAATPASVDARLALADVLRRQEAFAEAADAYGAAIDLLTAEGRENWTLHYQRGVAFERAKQWPKAEAEFKRALELEPDQPLVLNYLGYSWVEMGLNLDQAKEMIERAVEQRPEDGYITDSLGWVLYRLGDYEGAVRWLEQAVELAPVDPVINDHLGDALWKVGRTREAAFQWRRARSFDPEPDVAARIRRKLAEGLDAVLEDEKAAAAAARDGG